MAQKADPEKISERVRDGMPMRTGRALGRTLYLASPDLYHADDICVGIVDTPELAGEIARRWNRSD